MTQSTQPWTWERESQFLFATLSAYLKSLPVVPVMVSGPATLLPLNSTPPQSVEG
jgi:hypothetical protein